MRAAVRLDQISLCPLEQRCRDQQGGSVSTGQKREISQVELKERRGEKEKGGGVNKT